MVKEDYEAAICAGLFFGNLRADKMSVKSIQKTMYAF